MTLFINAKNRVQTRQILVLFARSKCFDRMVEKYFELSLFFTRSSFLSYPTAEKIRETGSFCTVMGERIRTAGKQE